MKLLEDIAAVLPALPPESREDIIQDIAVLVLEGKIKEGKSMAEGILKNLPALKRKYPSLRFQLSLDAPVNNSEGTTSTFGDIIVKPGVAPKRRKLSGRPRSRKTVKSVCENCSTTFYFKVPSSDAKLTKKQEQRLSLLPRIDPKFWTDEDAKILKVGSPRLLASENGGRKGRFCSRGCTMEYFRQKRMKLPGRGELVDLYDVKRLSTVKIAKMYGVSDPHTVRQALLKYGVRLRSTNNGTAICIEDGCGKPAHKITHSGNGSSYGTRCIYHRKLHYADLNRHLTRKKRNIPPERWRYS